MEFTPFHAALLILLIFINRPIAILLHELAHGITALILSREKVSIYVGSYGDRSECYHLKFGLLDIYLKKQFSLWRKGLCVPESKKLSTDQRILYVFMGPFMTLLIALGLGVCVFLPDLSFPFRLAFIVMSLSNFLAAQRSFVPNPRPITIANDDITYNDGQTLRNLFKYKRLEAHYNEAGKAYNSQQFALAGDLFRAALKTESHNPDLFRYTFSAYSMAKDYVTAAEIYLQFEQTGAMNAKDFNDAGLNYAYMLEYEQGLACFDKALALEPDQPFARTNRAFSFLMLGRYQEAIALFDKLFNKDPENAYFIANRGLAKSKLGQSEEALSDMERAQKIDPEESYVYRSLGIYYLDRGDRATALTHFKKAQELNPETHLIEQLMAAAGA
ncbi:MAG: tetratricopeptide repeat protein [Bacteroidota bacterium]